MNKSLLGIIGIVFGIVVLFFVSGFLLVSKSQNNANEIKETLNKEKESINGSNIYGEFIDVESFKNSGLSIEWFDKETRTVNIKGRLIEGYVIDEEENGFNYILTTDGILYSEENNEYSIIKLEDEIKKIGIWRSFSNAECHPTNYLVLSTVNGDKYIDEDMETGNMAIKALPTIKSFTLPNCYPLENENDKMGTKNGFIEVLSDGTLKYTKSEVLLKNKKTKKNIVAKYVMFIDNGIASKYYIVDNDDNMYVVLEDEELIQSLATINNINITNIEGEEDLVNVKIVVDDVQLDINGLTNRSNY